MAAIVVCPSCQSKVRVSDHLAGRDVKCPKCLALIPSKIAADQTVAESAQQEADAFAALGQRPPSDKRMQLRLVYIRVRQQARSACDAVGFGPATGARIALVLVAAAALFGIAMVAAFCLRADPARAAVQAITVGAIAFASGSFLLLSGNDAQLWTDGVYLAAALPDAKVAWEEWHRGRREIKERLREKRQQQNLAWEEWKKRTRETEEQLLQERETAAEARAIEAERVAESDTRRCPFCAEEILALARKCKHCGEFLDPAERAGGKSAGVAAVLEVLPGLVIQTFGIGHIYAGHVGTGLCLMFGYWLILFVNGMLVFACGIGFVTGFFCWVMMMIFSTLSAANCAQVGGGPRVTVQG